MMKRIFQLYLIILSIVVLTTICPAQAKKPETVNILTWWGYLNHPEITKQIEKSCNVKISYDEYYTNDEFIRRWKEQKDNYDVIIFSYTIYNLIKKDIPKFPNSELWKESKFYNDTIRKVYQRRHFSKNTVFFLHSLTGFLFNPATIHLSYKDSISKIFDKAKNNIVVFIDDPSEAIELLRLGYVEIPKQSNKDELLKKYFLFLMKNSSIYIGNGLHSIYKNNNFAFSYVWSGEAIKTIQSQEKAYQFLIHPKLSYISSDLLSQISNSKASYCVARFLTSKKFTDELQNQNFYFSSYADINAIQNPEFKIMYKNFLQKLPSLRWISPANKAEFRKIDELWSNIKLQLVKNNYNYKEYKND